MAKRLPLPKKDMLPEMVIFHRDYPGEPRVILQVPNDDKTHAETYVLRMDKTEDTSWLGFLPCSKELKNLLSMDQHVAFNTRTGDCWPIEDFDAPTAVELAIGHARTAQNPRERSFQDLAASKRRNRVSAPVSPLRRWLGGRVDRGR